MRKHGFVPFRVRNLIVLLSKKKAKKVLSMVTRFELARAEPTQLAAEHLNHSVTPSSMVTVGKTCWYMNNFIFRVTPPDAPIA